jgi:(+)-pinoresinol hydroxylase
MTLPAWLLAGALPPSRCALRRTGRMAAYIGIALTTLAPVAALAQQPASQAATQRGNELYQYWCATCHGRGPGQPGTTALAAKYKGALPGLLEERTDLSLQSVRFNVRRGTSIMPFFRKTEISDADLDAIAQYLARNAAAKR